MVKAASDANHVPVSLNCWRKRFSVTLQNFNVKIITQAFLALFDNGRGNLGLLKCCLRNCLCID